MSMQDKKTTVSTDNVTIATTSTPLVGPNPHRIMLIVPAPVTNRITLSWAGAAVLDRGVTLYPGDPPLILKLVDMGSSICQPITAIAAVASETSAVTEVSLAP